MTKKDVRILAFESSCDETSTAVIKNGREIESLIVATQIKSHQRCGARSSKSSSYWSNYADY